MTDYTKLIHDYLAGELSSEDEARLFEGLSRNPEWREEMQLQLQMERAMEKDLRSIAVPSSAATAVFASLGFRRPSKWSQFFHAPPRAAFWSVRRIAFTGLSGMLLFSAGYFAFRSNADEKHRPIAEFKQVPTSIPTSSPEIPSSKGPGAAPIVKQTPFGQSVLPASSSNPRDPALRGSLEHKVAKPLSNNVAVPSFGPNEPLRYYSDIGNLYSVHYFTPQKMIGVSYGGQIFLSEDSGHSWALEHSGVSSDLYGIHFCDKMHGLAVGAKGTVLLTSDCGKSWHVVPSGTTRTLSTVRFVTLDTAYICGDNGTMLRSANGGQTWAVIATGVDANLFRMAFKNGMEGDVYGSNGLHLITTDGGATWKSIQ